MAEASRGIEIPRRTLFKASEVCDLVQVQPYVLRSWEAEFPGLGVSRADGATRVYRRADVERVVRIKRLLLDEGLTLAGARRRLEADDSPVGEAEAPLAELLGRNARERLTEVKRGLQSILELLASGVGAGGGVVGRPALATRAPARPAKVARRGTRPARPVVRRRSS